MNFIKSQPIISLRCSIAGFIQNNNEHIKSITKSDFIFNVQGISKIKFINSDDFLFINWFSREIFDSSMRQVDKIEIPPKLAIELSMIKAYISLFFKNSIKIEIVKTESPDFLLKKDNMVIKKIECTRFGKATFMALNQIETHTVNSELYLDKLEKLSLDKSKNIKLTKTTIEVKEPQQISRSIKFDDLKNLISQINKKLRLNIWGEDSQIERMLFVNIEHYYMDNTIFWKNLVVDYVKSYGSKYKDKFRRPVDYVLDNLINPLSIEVAFLFLELKPKDDVGFLVDKCINFKKIKNNKEFIIEEVGIFSANYRPHMDASLKKIINKNKK